MTIEAVELDEYALTAVADYQEARAARDAAEEQLQKARAVLDTFLASHGVPFGTSPSGDVLVTRTVADRRSLATDELKRDYPSIYTAYLRCKPTPVIKVA